MRFRRGRTVSGGSTYTEWVAYLDRVAAGEPGAAPVTEPLPEIVGRGALLRLSDRAEAAFRARLDAWSHQVDAALAFHTDPVGLEIGLSKARSQMAVAWELANTIALPDAVRASLQAMVRSTIEETQDDLERMADEHPDGRDTIGLLVRRASLRAVLRGEVRSTPLLAGGGATGSPGAPGRRILITPDPDGKK